MSAADRQLVEGVLTRQSRALAKTITLIESRRHDHRERARAVLEELLPHTGDSIRVGVSGPPGVGKSSFIEALGLHLISREHRVAVLAVDPSSSISGGSILGDKTRMERLSLDPNAYIRPSPTGGSLGGVTEKTRETILACEAAGYDVIIVETVGVGQSETAVAAMTDVFVLLQLPNAGDELQAMKKGVVELADVVVFNKIDLDAQAAEFALNQMKSALTMLRSAAGEAWRPPVLGVSALTNQGIPELWAEIERYREMQAKSGRFAEKRRHQALAWMWELIESGLRTRFHSHASVQRELKHLAQAVDAGITTPAAAASRLLHLFEN